MPHSSTLFAYLSTWQFSLLRWLGVRANESPGDARAELTWTNFPESWGVFVLLAFLAAGFYAIVSLYRREMSSCPVWMKTLLAALRCGVMLLIATILLNPAIVYVQSRSIQPTIVIGRDASRSMNTADVYSEPSAAKAVSAAIGKTSSEFLASKPTRAQIVNELLSKGGPKFLTAIERKGRLEVLDFADESREVKLQEPSASSPQLPPLESTLGGTNLASAIEQGLKAERPAAIILLSDGQHTAKEDVLQAARKAKLRGVPLLIVGVGDSSRPSGERVAKVFARPQAWQNEPFEIDAVINFQSAEAGSRRVELFEHRLNNDNQPSGVGQLVATAQVVVPDTGTGQAAVHFSRSVGEAGRYAYRARFETSTGNSDQIDNQAMSDAVNVLSRQSIRVLLVAGSPSWDYRLLQKLLVRDKTIDVSCWLQSLDEGRGQEGKQPITHLPRTRAELFVYDVVLLLDPNPEELDTAWVELIREFVGEHSGGLLFMAGPQYSGELFTNPRTADLAKLLPVKFGDLAALEIVSLVSSNQHPWPLQLVPANADHPVLRFYSEADESLRRWQSLPGVLWSFPAAEAAPASLVLAEHGDQALRSAHGQRPLIVAGRYGSGNTLYLGFNGTWRWRSAGRQAEFFDKFWIQAVRFLVEGRSQESRRRGYVQTDREHYEIGERVNVSARLQDSAFEPLTLPEVEATVSTPDSTLEKVPLRAVANQPGRYEAAFTARQTGNSTIRIQLSGTTAESGQIESSFLVELPSLETTQVWLNRPLLMDLAKLSGGKYFEVDELDQLAAAVPNRMEKIEERSRPRPLWDVPGMLVVLVGLLSTEWLLRRRFNLL